MIGKLLAKTESHRLRDDGVHRGLEVLPNPRMSKPTLAKKKSLPKVSLSFSSLVPLPKRRRVSEVVNITELYTLHLSQYCSVLMGKHWSWGLWRSCVLEPMGQDMGTVLSTVAVFLSILRPLERYGC